MLEPLVAAEMEIEKRKRSTKGRSIRQPLSEERNPQKAKRALEVYAETGNCHKAAEETGLSHATVLRLKQRNPEEFERINNVLAQKMQTATARCLDRVLNDPSKIDKASGVNLAVMSGIWTQRGMELQGRMPQAGLNVEDLKKAVALYDAIEAKIRGREIVVTNAEEVKDEGDNAEATKEIGNEQHETAQGDDKA